MNMDMHEPLLQDNPDRYEFKEIDVVFFSNFLNACPGPLASLPLRPATQPIGFLLSF